VVPVQIHIDAPVVLLVISPGIAKALFELFRYLLAGRKRKK
jgi:hypothetical protein